MTIILSFSVFLLIGLMLGFDIMMLLIVKLNNRYA